MAVFPPSPVKLGRKLLESQFVEGLVTPGPIERYTALIDPLWARSEVRAEIVGIHRQTPRSITLTLAPNRNWQGFKAGQHIPLTFEVDGRQHTRFYSPAGSALVGDRIELTITTHPEGFVSNHLSDHAHVGMVLKIGDAEGEFVIPDERPRRLLLISGGSGITPVMSMLRTLVDEGCKSQITFLHYARTAEDRLYVPELADIAAAHENVSVVRALTRGAGGDLKGRVSRRHLKSADKTYLAADTYVCGPGRLVDAVSKIWNEEGAAKWLHSESFTPPPPKVFAADATGTLSFATSGVDVENSGEPLLVQAERAGLRPRCGCRMGICHECVAHVEEGDVRDVQTGALRSVKDEYIQICVNAPVGDVTIDL